MLTLDRNSLAFSLVNALAWSDCTYETEHGTLPTKQFLDALLDLILVEVEIFIEERSNADI